MRLIDADELKNELSDKDYITYTHEYGDAIPIEWVMSAIDNAPTVDVYSEDDVQYAIKEGHQVGYEMAKAKYEKPINDLCNAYCKNCHAIYKSNECEDCICAQVMKLLNRR